MSISEFKVAGIGFSSVCIYVKTMDEVRLLKQTICQIFMKMSKNILFYLIKGTYYKKINSLFINNEKYFNLSCQKCLPTLTADSRKKVWVYQKKIVAACRKLLLAKHREAVHFKMCSELQSIADFCMHLPSYDPCSKISPKLP